MVHARRLTRMVFTGLVCLVAGLAGLDGSPASASTSSGGGSGSVSTLTLVTRGPARAVVRLPRLHLPGGLDSTGSAPSVDVSGPGEFYGVVFRPAGTNPGDDARELAMLRTSIPGKEYPAVILGSDADGEGAVGPLPKTLPGGRYIAYLAAKGRVSVTISFPTSRRPRVVRLPRRDPLISVDTVENGPAGLPGVALATGRTVEAGRGGLAYVSFSWWVMPVSAATYGFGCTYLGAPLDDAFYQVPGECASGGQAGVGGADVALDYFRLGLGWDHRGEGTYGEKTSVFAFGVPDSLGITGIAIRG